VEGGELRAKRRSQAREKGSASKRGKGRKVEAHLETSFQPLLESLQHQTHLLLLRHVRHPTLQVDHPLGNEIGDEGPGDFEEGLSSPGRGEGRGC